MKLALHGATGRMGRAIVRLAHAADDIQIVGAVCSSVDPAQGRDVGDLAGVGAATMFRKAPRQREGSKRAASGKQPGNRTERWLRRLRGG